MRRCVLAASLALSGLALISANATLAGTVGTTPLHGCDAAPGFARMCPAVSLVNPPTVITKGTTVTFRGRVADPSKDFLYRIAVSHGGINAPVEISATHHAHVGVVFPARRWRAALAGAYTVCVIGSHDAPSHPVAHDCRTFTVR